MADTSSLDIRAGSIVKPYIRYPFKNEITRKLAYTHHRFVVVRINDDDTCVVYLLTTQLEHGDDHPWAYFPIESEGKKALVELNAWGTIPIKSISKVTDRLSTKEYYGLIRRINNFTNEQTTIIESQKRFAVIQ